MKHILQIAAIALLTTALISCNKEEETNTNTTPQDTTQTTTQKHNVELVYGQSPSTQWQHIELDTIQKYSNDQNVDTIFMIPDHFNQYSTTPTNGLQIIVPKLRERKNINPNKVWGKGELQLKASSVSNHYEIVRFFQDTLGYTVTYNESKGR